MFAVEDKFKITVPSEPVALQRQLNTVGDLVAFVDRLVAEQHRAPAQAVRDSGLAFENIPKPDEPEPNKDYDRRLTEDGEIDHDCGGID